MKGGKSGPEKYYYFLLPKLSGRCSVFDNMREIKMTGNKITGRPRNKHDIQIDK